jgi:hypothetical protein
MVKKWFGSTGVQTSFSLQIEADALECGKLMRRKVMNGFHAGQPFWAVPAIPSARA